MRAARVRARLPRPRVHVVSVEVIDEAVFVGGERFVAAVDVNAAAVERAAVAVAPLRNGSFSLRHQPRVGP